MSDSIQDHIRRSVAPRLVVAASRLRPRQRIAARAARLTGKPLRVELYFAFDDAYSAIAVPGLLQIASQYSVDVLLYPIVSRGIPNDPAASARLAHSIKDADQLAGRQGRRLMRQAPIPAEACAFLAAWTESLQCTAAASAFASRAIEQLWFNSKDEIDRADFSAFYQSSAGREPPSDQDRLLADVRDNTARLISRGHWESPVANLYGEWFFAHERLGEIANRIFELQS